MTPGCCPTPLAAQEFLDRFEREHRPLEQKTLGAMLFMYGQAGMPEDAAAMFERIKAAGYEVRMRHRRASW